MTRTLIAAAFAVLVTSSATARNDGAPHGARQCIGRHGIRDETAESDSRLILHVGGSKAYRNYLSAPCDGLSHVNTVSKLRFRSADPARLCEGDTLELLDHDGALGIGGDPVTTRCTLGRFAPINEMSLSENVRR